MVPPPNTEWLLMQKQYGLLLYLAATIRHYESGAERPQELVSEISETVEEHNRYAQKYGYAPLKNNVGSLAALTEEATRLQKIVLRTMESLL